MKNMKRILLFGNTTISKSIIPAIIVLNLCISIFLSKILNVWLDEAYSLHTTQYNVGQAILRALNFEEQPPFYFLLLNIWRTFNKSIFFARLLSTLFILITLIVVSRMLYKLFKDIHPGWVFAPFALNPFILWAATEIRVYALVILLSTLLCYFFFDVYIFESTHDRKKWYYISLSVIALYSFYYLGFLLLANALSLIVLKRWRSLRKYLIDMIIVVICFAPLIFFVINQLSMATSTIKGSIPIMDGLRVVRGRFADYILPVGRGSFLNIVRRWIVYLSTAVILFLIFRKRRSFIVPYNITLISVVFVLFITLVILLILLGSQDLLEYRHTLFIFPLLYFCLISVMKITTGKKGVIICSIIMLFFVINASIVKFSPRAKLGDWSRVASYIMALEKTDQPIFIYRPELALPFEYHYSGLNEIVPIPGEINIEKSTPGSSFINNEMELHQVVSEVIGDNQQCWLITDFINEYRDIRYSNDILEQYINKNFSTINIKNFFGTEVRFIHKKNDYFMD